MECKDIRRQNLKLLIQRLRTAKAIADKVDTAPNYLNEIKRGERDMGDDLARRIEARLELARGWMDHPQEISHGVPPFTVVEGKQSDNRGKAKPDIVREAYRLVDRAAFEEKKVLSPETKERMVDIVIGFLEGKAEVGTVKALLRVVK